jgi:hypothetical protein
MRIASRRHHDRNRCACRLGRERRGRSPRHDDLDIETHQFAGELGEALVATVRRTVFKGEVLTLDIAALAQSLLEVHEIGIELPRTRVQHPDTIAPRT